ncbi:MAG: cobalamin-binding protein [Candidatus Hydrothermia bacterium]|nr:cobalamin-binding protein [Candidatus Hydrothermia bacterium]
MLSRLFFILFFFGCYNYNKTENLRIVSLVPSATEIIYLLNADSFLVGITNQDNYNKFKVGDMLNPDYEKIIKLKPSLVILTLPLQKKILEEISKLNINTLIISPQSIDDIFKDIIKIGKILNKEKRALFLVDSLKSVLSEIKNNSKNLENNKVFYEIWDNPLWTAGNKTFINDVLRILNLKNIFDDRDGYFIVSEEEVIKRNPDIIIIAHSNVKISDIKNRKFWQNINAVKNNKIIIVDENSFNKPSPSLIGAIKFLSSQLY